MVIGTEAIYLGHHEIHVGQPLINHEGNEGHEGTEAFLREPSWPSWFMLFGRAWQTTTLPITALHACQHTPAPAAPSASPPCKPAAWEHPSNAPIVPAPPRSASPLRYCRCVPTRSAAGR